MLAERALPDVELPQAFVLDEDEELLPHEELLDELRELLELLNEEDLLRASRSSATKTKIIDIARIQRAFALIFMTASLRNYGRYGGAEQHRETDISDCHNGRCADIRLFGHFIRQLSFR